MCHRISKMKNTKSFGIFNLIGLSLLVLILLLVTPLGIMGVKAKESPNENNGAPIVLEIWNIDTFAGGNISKKDFLDMVSKSFESHHKSVYIKTTNMSIEEFNYAISDGKRPDLISFGYGVGAVVSPHLKELNINCESIKKEVALSGVLDSRQYAIGYLMGGYGFFTTEEKLASASKLSEVDLSKEYMHCGYEVNLRKSQKHIYGLCIAKSNFICSNNCLDEVVENEIYRAEDEYNAYLDFLGLNKSTILLGTQRDLVRLENKISNGSLNGLVFMPSSKYNDLIQYIGIVRDSNNSKFEKAQEFIEFLISENSQKLLVDSGMFSTTLSNLYESGNFQKFEGVVWSIQNIPCVF